MELRFKAWLNPYIIIRQRLVAWSSGDGGRRQN